MVSAFAGLGATAAGGGWGIPIGAPVHDAWGEKIGSVAGADAYGLVVERGLFLVRDYIVRLSDVERFEGGRLYLKLTKDEVLGVGRIG